MRAARFLDILRKVTHNEGEEKNKEIKGFRTRNTSLKTELRVIKRNRWCTVKAVSLTITARVLEYRHCTLGQT